MKILKFISVFILTVSISSCGTTKTLKQDNEQLSQKIAAQDNTISDLKQELSLKNSLINTAIQPVLQDIQDLENLLSSMEKSSKNLTKQNLEKADKQIDEINSCAAIVKGLLPDASKKQFGEQINRYKALYQRFLQSL